MRTCFSSKQEAGCKASPGEGSALVDLDFSLSIKTAGLATPCSQSPALAMFQPCPASRREMSLRHDERRVENRF